MSRIWDFHGGVHPPENKQQSLQTPIDSLPLPKRLTLPMSQHIGNPAIPMVEVGDKVLKGQRIAEPNGPVSIYMHAPTSGTVVDIAEYPVPHPSGMSAECIVIETDGEDRWVEGIEHQIIDDFRSLEKADLAEVIRCAGISGMGGAGFPTNIKLHLSDDHIVNTLIINGVECEPYITADDALMRERANMIIGGIEIAAYLIKPTHILIGLEDNKPQSATAMREAARHSNLNIEVVVVPTKYPSGGEKQLIQLLTGIEVPHGQLPADIGIVMQNVGTMVAVHDAVHAGKPLISRITTLTGEAAANKGNVEVLFGTPISDLLAFAGCDEQKLSRLVMGGPMMGFTLEDPTVPVVKTTNCIIAGTLDEFPPAPPAQNCILCGACEQVCPAELLPQQLFWFAKGKEFDKALNYNLMDCIECGACAYVCPSHIPLVQYYRFAKGEIRKEQAEHEKAEQARIRFEARKARLEAAEREKEERRKARAEAAAKAQAKKKDSPSSTVRSSDSRVGKTGAGAGAAAADPVAELKALKTQAAVARTKLKKAEKALASAEANGSDALDALKTAVEQAQQKVSESQQALEQAEQAQPAAKPANDLDELKSKAEKARLKVEKTSKTLEDAKAKEAPNVDKLSTSLAMLEQKAEEAEQAYQQALDAQQAQAGTTDSEAATSDTPAVDVKALKSAVAIGRTKVKKAEKALTEAQNSGSDKVDALQQAVNEQQQKLQEAEQALAAADTQPSQVSGQAPDIKALKTAAAVARTKVKKTEKALAEARAQGADSAEQLERALTDLKAKAEAAQQALEAAQENSPPPGKVSTQHPQ